MIIDPLSQAMTAEHRKGDEELALSLSAYLRGRERKDFLRFFRRSSNICGAIPLIISRGEGLKLAISAATEDEVCVEFDKPGGIIVAVAWIDEEPESIVENEHGGQ